MSTKSIVGLLAATARAMDPPNESPTIYIGLSGKKECCNLIVLSTNSTKPA